MFLESQEWLLLLAEISCGVVAPCTGYLKGGAGDPSPACCSGLKKLNAAGATTPDRQAACNCLKSAISGLSTNIAAGLPAKCGVNIPCKISTSTNCSVITSADQAEAAAAGSTDRYRFMLIPVLRVCICSHPPLLSTLRCSLHPPQLISRICSHPPLPV
ncbi:non-specific lipid-transfer protein [Trifolium repens]|nr:non-specific lipid-transfer protein [Trifolium repens]